MCWNTSPSRSPDGTERQQLGRCLTDDYLVFMKLPTPILALGLTAFVWGVSMSSSAVAQAVLPLDAVNDREAVTPNGVPAPGQGVATESQPGRVATPNPPTGSTQKPPELQRSRGGTLPPPRPADERIVPAIQSPPNTSASKSTFDGHHRPSPLPDSTNPEQRELMVPGPHNHSLPPEAAHPRNDERVLHALDEPIPNNPKTPLTGHGVSEPKRLGDERVPPAVGTPILRSTEKPREYEDAPTPAASRLPTDPLTHKPGNVPVDAKYRRTPSEPIPGVPASPSGGIPRPGAGATGSVHSTPVTPGVPHPTPGTTKPPDPEHSKPPDPSAGHAKPPDPPEHAKPPDPAERSKPEPAASHPPAEHGSSQNH
jgi:hypothetical protein